MSQVIALTQVLGLSLALVALCGLFVAASPPKTHTGDEGIGKITLDGKPPTAGKITFYRSDGQFVGSKVKNGKYAIDHMPVGVLKVTIEGKGVPARYASENTSPLTVEIKKGGGKSRFDFDLRR